MNISGFTRLGLILACSVSLAGANELYWADLNASEVNKSDLSVTNLINLVSGGDPSGLAVDATGGKVYWTEANAGTISRANLNGTLQQIIVTGLTDIYAIDVDSAGGKLYWHDISSIYRCNLDGTGVQLLTNSATGFVDGIAVDPANGKLYWSDYGVDRIYQSNLDGSGRIAIITNGLSNPHGLDVDSAGGKLYWVDGWPAPKVRRSNLSGTGIQNLVTNGLSDPADVVLDLVNQRMYWTEYSGPIRNAKLDGTDVGLVLTGTGSPYGIDGIFPPPCPYFQGIYSVLDDIPANVRGVETADGGYAVASGARLVGDPDNSVFLLKTDIGGAQQWVRRFGGAGDDAANYMCETEGTNLVLAGRTDSFGAGGQDVYVLKTDANGNLIWSYTYGTVRDEFANHILATSDKGFLVSGTFLRTDGTCDIYLVKIRGDGLLQWACTYDVDRYDEALGAVQLKTPIGTNTAPIYIITGRTGPNFVSTDVLLFGVNSTGMPAWASSYGGAGADIGYSVLLHSNSLVVAGVDASFGVGQTDGLLMKTSVGGLLQWAKTFGWTGADQFRSVVVAPDKGLAVGGFTFGPVTNTPSAPYRYWLVKASGSGAFQWSRIYGDGLSSAVGVSLDNADNGGYYLSGQLQDGFFNADFYSVRPDSFGLVQFEGPYDPTCYVVVQPQVKTFQQQAGRHIAFKRQGVQKAPNTGDDNELLLENIFCIGCTPCPLDAAWKKTGTPAQPGFYWARDTILQGQKIGDPLISDFYTTAGAVSVVVEQRADLAARLARYTIQVNALLESYEANPDEVLQVSASLVHDGVGLAHDFLNELDLSSVKLLQPWVDWAESDVLGLLGALGVNAELTK